MTVRRLDHVYFWTRNMGAAVAFYRDAVGLELVEREGDTWAAFDAGSVRFALHGRGAAEPTPPGGTVVFEVGDLDEARWRMEQRGVTFDGGGEIEGRARFASFRDPDANLVQIIEHLGPDSHQD